jgi:DNA replication and repair protein RecF
VFHVEHGFLEAWRRYDQGLKQRNAALKTGTDGRDAGIWDQSLSGPATIIHQLRSSHIESLNRLLSEYASAIAGEHEVEVGYQPGWDTEKALETVLAETRQRDLRRGFTCAGPHRAELVFYVDGRPADNYVSRGQQKMLVIALLLAQIALFSERTGRRCVLLIDDLAAELDDLHRGRLLEVLRTMDIQIFITAVRRDAVDLAAWPDSRLFHVEHGRVGEVV